MPETHRVYAWVPLAEEIPNGERLENGDVVLHDFKLLEYGAWENGGRDATLTQEMAAQMRENAIKRGRPIAIWRGHPQDRDAAPAAAWIDNPEDLEVRDDGLYATTFRILSDTDADISAGKFRGFSPEFHPNATDPEGNEIGAYLAGGGFTNVPRLWGLEPHPYLMAEQPPEEDKEMTVEDIQAAMAKALEPFEERIKALETLPAESEESAEEPAEGAALSEQLAERDDKIAQLSEKVKAAEDKADRLEMATQARDIKAIVSKGKSAGKLTPRQTDGFDADPIAWLSESPWAGKDTSDGIDRLTAYLATAEPVLTFAQISGNTTDTFERDPDLPTKVSDPKLIEMAERSGLTPEKQAEVNRKAAQRLAQAQE